jgi:hypothetical protein
VSMKTALSSRTLVIGRVIGDAIVTALVRQPAHSSRVSMGPQGMNTHDESKA